MAPEMHYYHLRCGGKLVYVGPVQDEEAYRCELCDHRGIPLTESMVDGEDREEGSDRFDILPTTFMVGDQTITVCELIMDMEQFKEDLKGMIPPLKRLDFESE
jgi:hypothetical protein